MTFRKSAIALMDSLFTVYVGVAFTSDSTEHVLFNQSYGRTESLTWALAGRGKGS
jgi:hypothetical protein